jgi:hypothetical protein
LPGRTLGAAPSYVPRRENGPTRITAVLHHRENGVISDVGMARDTKAREVTNTDGDSHRGNGV